MKLFRSRIFIVLFCLILAVAGVAAASAAGWIRYRDALSKIPFVKEIVAHDVSKAAPTYDQLKQENDSLKKRVQALEEEAVLSQGLQAGASGAGSGSPGAPAASDNLAGNPVANQEQKEMYRDLAEYYASMKPASAVAILGNQDPQMVSGILREMDKDQAGQILAAMDPAQAAKILKLIAGIDSGANQ